MPFKNASTGTPPAEGERSAVRERNSSRSSRSGLDGTKLGRISPQQTSSAIHSASLMSVLRPGTFLMCRALPTISSNAPSSTA